MCACLGRSILDRCLDLAGIRPAARVCLVLLACVGAAARPPRPAPAPEGLTRLAKAIGAFDQKEYDRAAGYLRGLREPKLADYVAYYLTAARLELKDTSIMARDVAPVRATSVISPFAAKSWLLEGRALLAADQGAQAVQLLREHYADLPQPDGDLALAMSYEAGKDLPQAAGYYQRVYYFYPLSDAAVRAAAALLTLKDTLGQAYPAPTPALMLERANKFLAAGDYVRARAEYLGLVAQLPGVERDLARVGVGAADGLNGKWPAAYQYLRDLTLTESEADAQRLYYLSECGRRLGDDDEIDAALQRLARAYPRSIWRYRALVGAANRYLLQKRPDRYIPLYRAVYESFPAEPQAAYCHWKVTWAAYIGNKSEGRDLLRRHLMEFPFHGTASAALYFLGRLAERDRDFATARADYARIVDLFPNYYYGTLARERMSQPQLISAVASAKESEFLNGIAFPPRGNTTALRPTSSTTARIERARLLRQAGLADLADSELRFGAGTDGQPQLLAIELAHSGTSAFQRLRLMKSVHMDYLAMNVDEVDRRFWEYLFPLPYEGDLVRNARAQGLDPFAVAALVRQESEFNPQALSPARAYGLTQVRPSTGRQLARHFGVRRFSNRMLFQPSTNLKLGTYYIRSLLDNWGGKWELTLASYNAGPGRAKEWVTWHQYREPAEFVETIPFTETREYVQAVLRNAALYRQIYQDRRLRATPEKSVKAAPKKRKSRAGARQRPAPKKKTAKRRR